jgi:hypothetical protein
LRLTAAFVAHELRTQGRSLRFRTVAALYVFVGSLPGVLVYLRRSDSPFAIGGGAFAFEAMNALPLLTALFAFLLSLDGISREQGEGAWTTVTLCEVSNAGYLLRRWLALLAVILPLTAIPLGTAAIAATVALSAEGGPGAPNLWVFAGPWLVHILPLALASSAFGLGIGTIGGGALGALPLLGTVLVLVPMLGNEVAHRFGMRFSGPLVWLDQMPAMWLLNRAAEPLTRRNVYGWDFPLPASEAGFDLRVMGDQHLADGAFLGALAALSLGIAAIYLRRTRPDVRPRRVGPKHPFRGFLRVYSRTLEHYKPDPAPARADRLAVAGGLLLAVALTAVVVHRGLHFESLAMARIAAEAQAVPAPIPVTVVPGRWRVEGRIGPGQGVALRVAAEMLNQGKEPSGHLAFQLNPELQMEVTADSGRVSAIRNWDRLGLVLEPPIPPGGRRELRFRLAGEPSRPVFPIRGEGTFAERIFAHRNAQYGHDRLILAQSFRAPSVSGYRVALWQGDLVPLPRYAAWQGEDGTAEETVIPLAEVELSITGPPGVFLADSCGGIGSGIGGGIGGKASPPRLSSRCRIALTDLAVAGGHYRLLRPRGDSGAANPVAIAVFKAHTEAAQLHMGFLARGAGMLEEAWPGFGALGNLAVVEWPHDYVLYRNSGMYFPGWYRNPWDNLLTVMGNLAFLEESDLIQMQSMRPESLVAEVLSVRLASRRRVVPEQNQFFLQFFRRLALERLGLGPQNGAVVGPLSPPEEEAAQVSALDGSPSWSYWRFRFPAIIAALESRMGAEPLRLAVEEFLARGNTSEQTPSQPPGTVEELVAVLARHSAQPVERLLQDSWLAGDLPYPVLEGVEFRRAANEWRVTGRFVNQGKGEALCKLVLTTDLGPEQTILRADSGGSTSFALATRHRPQGVFLDPNQECHRLVRKGAPRDRVYFEGGGT